MFKGTNSSISVTHRRNLSATCCIFGLDELVSVRPVPVGLVRDIHVLALFEIMGIEVKNDQAPVHTTAPVVQPYIHTIDEESTDPLRSEGEHGIAARTACI